MIFHCKICFLKKCVRFVNEMDFVIRSSDMKGDFQGVE
ncbi:hypothetical protein HC081234_18710 [Helicobacter cinaedi]|nr:hypothetical protein HC081234_18710 [Helicobacter cinaedi]